MSKIRNKPKDVNTFASKTFLRGKNYGMLTGLFWYGCCVENCVSVCINGKNEKVPAGSALVRAIELSGAREPYAVAVNNVLVTKAEYENCILNDEDIIDIVYPMQGG